ncbi:MAG: hypothetical protein J0H99_04165 [Rhodospirillales bacterium]|nr:hypothetical protein [Rhodospirillales bacterium]
MPQESAGPEKILHEPTPFCHHIIIGIHPSVKPFEIRHSRLPVVPRRQSHIITRGNIFSSTKTINIVCLIEFLPEKGKLRQGGFPVVKPEVEFVGDLIGYIRKMVLEIPEADELAIQHGCIGEEAVATQVPSKPYIMGPVAVIKKHAVRPEIVVDGMECPQVDPPCQMGIGCIQRTLQPQKPGLFIRRAVLQVAVDLGVRGGDVDKPVKVGFGVQQLVAKPGVTVLFRDDPSLYPLPHPQKVGFADIAMNTVWRQAGQFPANTEKVLYHHYQVHGILGIRQIIYQNTGILDKIQTTDPPFIIRNLERVKRRVLFNKQ